MDRWRAWLEHRITEAGEQRQQPRTEHPIYQSIARSFPGLHRDFQSLRIVDWNRNAIELARQWCRSNTDTVSRGLSLRDAQTGSGKTSLITVAILETVKRTGIPATYCNVPDMLTTPFGHLRTDIIETAKRAPLLLLDDIDAGVKRGSAGDEDNHPSRLALYTITNHRYNHGMPTCWTSNARSSDALLHNLGERIHRRITSNTAALQFGDDSWDWGVALDNGSMI